MRLRAIHAKEILPVKHFSVDNLSDVIVLAGRNGVGKTRLVQGILSYFQNIQGSQNTHIIIDATCKKERESWGKSQLDTSTPDDRSKLQQTLQENRFRRNWKSSVINIESDRSIQRIDPYRFSWDIQDPDEEAIGWNFLFSGLRGRYQDTLHSIFRKVQSHRDKISSRAEALMRKGEKNMELNFPDPLEQFKHTFRQLLAPKQLLDADLKSQQLKYHLEGKEFPLNSLSSGEKEVINIVFDFILRNPSDCIVVFDEPELHLHPELSFKLIQTLTNLGSNNQFLFCTHSPDIITASLDNSVIFIGPPNSDGGNQAIPVSEDDETNHALKLLGQSVGIIALGKKIVLIEGANTSLDKQTYGAILKDTFPDLVLAPSGGKGIIKSFSTLITDVIEKSIWGVEFFMLCDRDAVPFKKSKEEIEDISKGRLKILERYHLENYFLDENILSIIFENIEPKDSWLRSSTKILERLKIIATEMISYSVALYTSAHFRDKVGNLDIMPKECHGKTNEEIISLIINRTNREKQRIEKIIDRNSIETIINDTYQKISDSLVNNTDEWKKLIPGKQILNIFSSQTGIQIGRLKRAFINIANNSNSNPFKEIIDIFNNFNRM